MWFKNIYVFRFLKPFTLSAEELEQRLGTNPFIKCGKLDAISEGWVAPFKGKNQENPPLVHVAQNCFLLALRKQEKILPATVVNEYLQEKIQHFEELQQRHIRKRERDALRDEVLQDLLPRAFTRTHILHAYIDASHGWLVVNSASRKKAEEFASILRKTLGSLPIVCLKFSRTPATVMTAWLTTQDYPEDFALEDACELAEADSEGAVVNCKRQNLLSDELQGHLSAGKLVTRLALQWQAHMAFVLTEEFILKRLQFLEVVKEQAQQDAGEDATQQFDADFILMTGLLARLFERLFKAFGGEDEAAYQQFLTS
jgi:recombination associated protein RdgC